jgi:hypothetical protein
MIEFYLGKSELEEGLAAIERSEKDGFVATQAIFKPRSVVDPEDPTKELFDLKDGVFSKQLILKAHPTDPNQNWGRSSVDEALSYQINEKGQCVSKHE